MQNCYLYILNLFTKCTHKNVKKRFRITLKLPTCFSGRKIASTLLNNNNEPTQLTKELN